MMSGVRASSMRIESTSSTMRVVVPALHLVGQRGGHVVAQVVEAELVVGAVGDVGRRSWRRFSAGLLLEAGDDQADVEPEPVVDPAHPLGVEAGQVVVDRDEVHALAAEPVEVGRQVLTSVLPSPVFISATQPKCSAAPPINCTSKWRWPIDPAGGLAA